MRARLKRLFLVFMFLVMACSCGQNAADSGDHAGIITPQLSPDNKLIVFGYCQGGTGQEKCDLGTYEIATGKVSRFIPTEYRFNASPSYSRDGKRLTFVAGEDTRYIYVAQSDGSNAKRLTYYVPDSQGIKKDIKYDAMPTFSPDGNRVIFERASVWRERAYPLKGSMLSHWDVYEVDLKSGTEKRLTHYEFYDMERPYYMPDGRRFIFSAIGPKTMPGQFPASAREYQEKYRGNNIFIMDGRKNELHPAFVNGKSSNRPSISNGGDILFTSITNEMDKLPDPFNYDLFLYKNGKISRITKMGAHIVASAISNDGTMAVFLAITSKPRNNRVTLWIVNTDGTGLKKIPLPWDKLKAAQVQLPNK